MRVNSDTADLALALSFLKADLGYYDSQIPAPLETSLTAKVVTAIRHLERDNITLNLQDIEDCQLISMYARWLYRHGEAGTAKPPMVQTEIRNRQVAKATAPEVSP